MNMIIYVTPGVISIHKESIPIGPDRMLFLHLRAIQYQQLKTLNVPNILDISSVPDQTCSTDYQLEWGETHIFSALAVLKANSNMTLVRALLQHAVLAPKKV